MTRCHSGWEDVYIKENIRSPHCNTCDCQRNELEVRRQITRPVYNRRMPCDITYRKPMCYHNLEELVCSCTCYCKCETDMCLCYECRKVRGRSEASIHRKKRFEFSRQNNFLLQSWFSRFDRDGDGYLDVLDLESLLKHLGANIQNSYSKRLLRTCDRDCDGLLSFPEFISLWRCAALHDEHFLRSTGCCDLSPIVKKYKLYPDTRSCECQDNHCKHVTFATEFPVQSVKCKCGLKEKVVPFVKHEPKNDPRANKHPKDGNDPGFEDPFNLPTMSLNRDNVM